MTANKTTLTLLFQTGDVPTGNDYANFIDSCVNQAETSAQIMSGPLVPTELITPVVSAGTLVATNQISTPVLYVNVASAAAGRQMEVDSSNIYTARFQSSHVQAVAIELQNTTSNSRWEMAVTGVSGAVSLPAGSWYIYNPINGYRLLGYDVSAQDFTINPHGLGTIGAFGAVQGFRRAVALVSAAGSAQATASPLTADICVVSGIADGQTTGVRILGGYPGRTQMVINGMSVSANIWPPTGGAINNLAANAAFAFAANGKVTVTHYTSSQFYIG